MRVGEGEMVKGVTVGKGVGSSAEVFTPIVTSASPE